MFQNSKFIYLLIKPYIKIVKQVLIYSKYFDPVFVINQIWLAIYKWGQNYKPDVQLLHFIYFDMSGFWLLIGYLKAIIF